MRIDTPEDYLALAWAGAEQGWKGPLTPTDAPVPAPHPNEVATREAAAADLYPVVVDDHGHTVHPLDVVGARGALPVKATRKRRT